MATIRINAKRYEDEDDCLAAAAAEMVLKRPYLQGWDLRARWESEQRDAILLDVPAWTLQESALSAAQLRDLRLVTMGYTRGQNCRTCDSLVARGLLRGDWTCGYDLTETGQAALREVRQ